jgi:hypothetical protein
MSRDFIAALIGLTLGSSTLAAAQSQGTPSIIADNEGLFFDGKTFKITSGKVRGDASTRIETSARRKSAQARLFFA